MSFNTHRCDIRTLHLPSGSQITGLGDILLDASSTARCDIVCDHKILGTAQNNTPVNLVNSNQCHVVCDGGQPFQAQLAKVNDSARANLSRTSQVSHIHGYCGYNKQ